MAPKPIGLGRNESFHRRDPPYSSSAFSSNRSSASSAFSSPTPPPIQTATPYSAFDMQYKPGARHGSADTDKFGMFSLSFAHLACHINLSYT